MTSPSDVEPEFEGTLGEYVAGLLKQIQTLTEERERQFRETTSIHEDLLALGRAVGAPYDGCSSPAGYLHGDIMPKVAALTEEREEAIIRERTFYNNWQEARANEAAQIAKGLQLAAQLDEARQSVDELQDELALLAVDHHRMFTQLDQARALLQQFGTRKPDGQPTTWARAKDVEAFLQPSNEEGPQPLRPNPTVKSI